MEFILPVLHAMDCSSLSSKSPAKISWLGNQQLSCLRLLPFIILSICNNFLRRFRLHVPMVPYPPIIPPCTFLNILFPIQDPSPLIMLIENPLRSRLWWHTRLTTLCGATPVMNERSLFDHIGMEVWPKAVLLLPGSEPFHILWFNFGAKKLALLPGNKLEDPP